MRFRLALLTASVALGACGTFSNEDLEFAAVLPDESLTIALPATKTMNALVPPASSPSFDAAIDTAVDLNMVALTIPLRLRKLTAKPAVVRRAGHREWGPLSVDGFTGTLRLIMDVQSSVSCELAATLPAGAKGYAWRLEASSSSGGTFKTLATGIIRGTDFATSCGAIDYDADVSRDLGGPETDEDPRSTHLAWQRSPESAQVQAIVTAAHSTDAPLVEGETYTYASGNEGGYFDFSRRFVVTRRPEIVDVLRATLQWGPNGTPWRADFQVQDSSGQLVSHGLTCGDDFGQPTYDRHDVPPNHSIDADDDESCGYDYPGGNDPDPRR